MDEDFVQYLASWPVCVWIIGVLFKILQFIWLYIFFKMATPNLNSSYGMIFNVNKTLTAPRAGCFKERFVSAESYLSDGNNSLMSKYPNATLLKCEVESSGPLVKPLVEHNGVVGTAMEAYNDHHTLCLRPDDLWISVMVGFAGHVDRNAEKMRHLFVEHGSGQSVQLDATEIGSIDTADYDSLVRQITEKLDKTTKADVVAWSQCDFSTTTKSSRFISRLVLMASMKNYFTYKFYLKCGR